MRDYTRTILTTTVTVKNKENVEREILFIGDVKTKEIKAQLLVGEEIVGLSPKEELWGITPENFMKHGHNITAEKEAEEAKKKLEAKQS